MTLLACKHECRRDSSILQIADIFSNVQLSFQSYNYIYTLFVRLSLCHLVILAVLFRISSFTIVRVANSPVTRPPPPKVTYGRWKLFSENPFPFRILERDPATQPSCHPGLATSLDH